MTTTNKKIVSIIGIVMVLITVLCCTLVGCSAKDVTSNTPTETTLDNDFTVSTNSTEYVKLAMTGVAYAAAETNSVNKTISATVLPATAANKAVDWSCEWANGTNTSNVSEYVTVTPDSDGSTTATVSCYKAFSGEILITVTTRESGYTATCIVTFIGIPTDIVLNGSIGETSGAYRLGVGQTYTYSVALSNVFNSVASQYNFVSVSVVGVGSINVGYMEHYNASGNDVWYDTSNKVIALNDIKDSFISASYANGQLTITTVKTIESYYSAKSRLDSGRTWGYTDKFRSYVDDCYFKITIVENTSGLSKDMIIKFDDSVVVGVNANVSEMTF